MFRISNYCQNFKLFPESQIIVKMVPVLVTEEDRSLPKTVLNNGVTEKRLWSYRVTALVLQSDAYSVAKVL
jgi:hypothetical protein